MIDFLLPKIASFISTFWTQEKVFTKVSFENRTSTQPQTCCECQNSSFHEKCVLNMATAFQTNAVILGIVHSTYQTTCTYCRHTLRSVVTTASRRVNLSHYITLKCTGRVGLCFITCICQKARGHLLHTRCASYPFVSIYSCCHTHVTKKIMTVYLCEQTEQRVHYEWDCMVIADTGAMTADRWDDPLASSISHASVTLDYIQGELLSHHQALKSKWRFSTEALKRQWSLKVSGKQLWLKGPKTQKCKHVYMQKEW